MWVFARVFRMGSAHAGVICARTRGVHACGLCRFALICVLLYAWCVVDPTERRNMPRAVTRVVETSDTERLSEMAELLAEVTSDIPNGAVGRNCFFTLRSILRNIERPDQIKESIEARLKFIREDVFDFCSKPGDQLVIDISCLDARRAHEKVRALHRLFLLGDPLVPQPAFAVFGDTGLNEGYYFDLSECKSTHPLFKLEELREKIRQIVVEMNPVLYMGQEMMEVLEIGIPSKDELESGDVAGDVDDAEFESGEFPGDVDNAEPDPKRHKA